MRNDVFQQITDAITAQLEAGTLPWSKPWTEGAGNLDSTLPHNIAGRAYRGANTFWLDLIGKGRGYSAPVWLTFTNPRYTA
jgi:antirestriction protein ArdC